ncbi:NAD(P)-dependent oxidoreductase [candidate division WOR-3 bacterium]|nr:NAD(P)-dependent oxidoreductase [candidate division WOR-3 bacterium]
MKKVLVTGASGFFGSHLCEEAHDAGYEVHALIRKTSSRRWLTHPRLHIHTQGLNKGAGLTSILKKMDVVIHNAAATAAYGKEYFHKVNVEATRMLAQESIKAGVKRFIYISSQAAGGPSKGPFARTEDEADCPVSAYGESKKKAEDELYKLREQIQVITLRFAGIYGPRNTEFVRVFRLLQGPFQPMVGLKTLYCNYIYVEDAVRAVMAALEARVASGSVYYVNDGIDYTLEHFYNLASEALEHKGMRIYLPLWLVKIAAWWQSDIRKQKSAFTLDKVREFKARFWLASPQKAIRELGWKPEVSPRDGLAATLRWFRYKRWI